VFQLSSDPPQTGDMGTLLGLQEYLKEHYHISIFDRVLESRDDWVFHFYGERIVRARVLKNFKYDLRLHIDGENEEDHPKTDIKMLYPGDRLDAVRPLLKTDRKVRELGLAPIIPTRMRHHIKNKSLFPLMKERRVLFFTLLEGEVIKGLITGFTRYEITVSLKGEIPVDILRHAVYDLRDKKGRCLLKSFQEAHRDWEKSELFVAEAGGD